MRLIEENWKLLRRLGELIEAEADGRGFDRAQAAVLAERLMLDHPEVAGTMARIRDRMREGLAGERRAA